MLTLGPNGLEPLTLRLSSVYSNQLSYRPYSTLTQRYFFLIKKFFEEVSIVLWRRQDLNLRRINNRFTVYRL